MSNIAVLVIAWCAVAVHVIGAFCAWRRTIDLPLPAMLNGAVALCVLAYWITRWYGYFRNGTTWYLTDQLVPLYALGVCVLVWSTLTGRFNGTVLQTILFSLHTVVFIGAALFFTFFRMDRLF